MLDSNPCAPPCMPDLFITTIDVFPGREKPKLSVFSDLIRNYLSTILNKEWTWEWKTISLGLVALIGTILYIIFLTSFKFLNEKQKKLLKIGKFCSLIGNI